MNDRRNDPAVSPDVHVDAWVAPTAQLFGAVTIGAGSSVWHNAVARAECQEIRVGRLVNLQDFVMVHVGYDHPTEIGDFCSIAHHTTIHGCRIGDQCLVGINTVVMDGAVIGAGSVVAGGAIVTEGREFPENAVIAGVPARQIGERDSSRPNRLNAWLYHRNAQSYRRGHHRTWVGAEFEAWKKTLEAEVAEDRDLDRL